MLNTYQGKQYHVLRVNWDSALASQSGIEYTSDDVMASLVSMGYAEEVESDDMLEYYKAIERLEDDNIHLVNSPETDRPMVLVSIVEHFLSMLDALLVSGHDGQTPGWICPDLDGLELWSDVTKRDLYKVAIGIAVYSYITERFKG